MPTTLLNGVQLYYQSEGTGDTVVLTHGSWGDGDGWGPTVDELRRNYRVVTWDRRGHTRSQGGESPGSQSEDTADLVALIEHLSDGPVHSVGNSYGSVIALNLMAVRPDLVISTAIHEPAALPLLAVSAEPEARERSGRLWIELDIVKAHLEAGRNREAPAHFINHVAFEPGTWEQMPEESKAALEANAHTFLDELSDPNYYTVNFDALADSKIPLLVTVGTESPAFLKMIVSEVSTHLPHAKVASIPGAGHVPHGSHPVEWSAVLTEFWRGISHL